MKKILSKLAKRKVLSASIVLVILVIGGFLIFRPKGSVETTTPIHADLVRSIKIAGKVVPLESAELGFETAGTVASISKDVGDQVRRGETIARLDSGATLADLAKSKAELSLAEANLDKLEGAGAYEAQVDSAKRALIQSITAAYTSADDAIHNKTDPIFIDPRASRPELVYSFSDNFALRDSIVSTRPLMDEKLAKWDTLLSNLTPTAYSSNTLSQSKTYLSEVSNYINKVAQAVNLFEAGGSLSQSSIDTYKNDALAARDSTNSASQNLISAEEKFQSLLGDIPVQVARVESARASVLNNQSQLAKTALVSPINGVVSRADLKVGEVVSGSTKVVTVISPNLLIEAYVPEVLVSGVKIGNIASVTLDAFGEATSFEATVTHIDPAETVRDGVSTYRIKLSFANSQLGQKSGMTANLNIETYKKLDTLLIPERSVVREQDKTFIYTLSGTEMEKLEVEVGERDSSGKVELISPLAEGTLVIINPRSN